MSNPEVYRSIYERPEVLPEPTIEELGAIALDKSADEPTKPEPLDGIALEQAAIRASWTRTLTAGLRKNERDLSR